MNFGMSERPLSSIDFCSVLADDLLVRAARPQAERDGFAEGEPS